MILTRCAFSSPLCFALLACSAQARTRSGNRQINLRRFRFTGKSQDDDVDDNDGDDDDVVPTKLREECIGSSRLSPTGARFRNNLNQTSTHWSALQDHIAVNWNTETFFTHCSTLVLTTQLYALVSPLIEMHVIQIKPPHLPLTHDQCAASSESMARTFTLTWDRFASISKKLQFWNCSNSVFTRGKLLHSSCCCCCTTNT